MPLFDRYIAVDWSAANTPVSGPNSIWIAEWHGGLIESHNPTTRRVAIAQVADRLRDSLREGKRTFVGFDFPFGYPAGGGEVVCGKPGWSALWAWLHDNVEDSDNNMSNRFALSGRVNALTPPGGPRFWGHHHQHSFEGLTRHRPLNSHGLIEEKRVAERRARTAQPVWKLYGNGSVGSQALLGIAWLEKLRRMPGIEGSAAVWPFETDFALNLVKPIVIAEIYPSIVKVSGTATKPKDQVQVETMVGLFSDADARNELGAMLSDPPNLTSEERRRVASEEGWIVGLLA